MIGAQTAPPESPLPEALRQLAPGLWKVDPAGVDLLLAPLLARMRETGCGGRTKDLVDAATVVCRDFFGHGRSRETLALVREVRRICMEEGDRAQVRRSTFLCAIVVGDTGDLIGAIEHHVEALRMAAADEDRLEMGNIWGNLGATMGNAGRVELSARCHRRCLALLEPIVQPQAARFRAYANLAQCHYHLGETDQGLRSGGLALLEEEGLSTQDVLSGILLRRNLARLLLEQQRFDEAEEHVAQAIVLANASPSPRAAIAAEITRAAHDLATGSTDLALTRIDRTLAQARRVPGTLRDALACAVRAEEAAGYPARAMLRLRELSEHLHGHAIQRTRQVIEYAGIDPAEPAAEHYHDQTKQRLATHLAPPGPPEAWATWRRLAAAAVLRMDETAWHGVRVGTLVKALALAAGTPPLQALELGLASELHDIGMSAVPEIVLAKPSSFNEPERSLVQRHPEAGAQMLVDDPHPRLLLARDIARYHHARWDGAGYPAGVAGEAIPMGARMCAIADAYDAMVCGLGRPRISMAEALAELGRCAGKQFDPELVSFFDAVVNGELEGLGLDPASAHGMEAFQELVAALREDRGFV